MIVGVVVRFSGVSESVSWSGVPRCSLAIQRCLTVAILERRSLLPREHLNERVSWSILSRAVWTRFSNYDDDSINTNGATEQRTCARTSGGDD